MSISQLATELGISRPTAYKYKGEGMPLDDLPAAREWVAKRKASDGRGGNRGGMGGDAGGKGGFFELKEQLQRANIRKTEAEAQLREFEAAQATRNLVSMDEAQAAIREVLAPLRVLLDSLPKACAVKANPSDPALAEDAIREGVDSVYRAMDQVKEDGADVA